MMMSKVRTYVVSYHIIFTLSFLYFLGATILIAYMLTPYLCSVSRWQLMRT